MLAHTVTTEISQIRHPDIQIETGDEFASSGPMASTAVGSNKTPTHYLVSNLFMLLAIQAAV